VTLLYFKLDDDLAKRAGPEVPVEVAGADLVLRNTTSSSFLQVKEGEYFVRARVPGLQTITSRIVVEEGQQSVDVELGAESAAPARVSLAREPGFLGVARRATLETPAYYLRGSILSIRLRMMQGNLFDGVQPVEVSKWEAEETDSGVIVKIPPSAKPSIAQVIAFGLAPINIILPIAANVGCSLVVRRRVPAPSVDCRLQHSQAGLLLELGQTGRLRAAEAMMGSASLQAERLLSDKDQDPIAAAVGAYALLRTGELESLHDWTQNLMERFPLLPDGAVLRGEHLARLGEHAAAADAFLAVRQRGLPIFVDGVSILGTRLDRYGGQNSMLDGGRAEQLRKFRSEFGEIASWVNSRGAIATFTGSDPMHPDDKYVISPYLSGAQPIP
jgi:hypothetical protein